jgi:hypothetical protein
MAAPCPLLIYVLYYDDYSHGQALKHYGAFRWAKPLRVETSELFENEAILRAPQLAEEDAWERRAYVGWLSWKAPRKGLLLRVPRWAERTLAALEAGDRPLHDVCAFAWVGADSQYGDKLARDEPTMTAIWDTTVCAADGRFARPFSTIWCNYWAARPEVVLGYARWLAETMVPALRADPRVLGRMGDAVVVHPEATPSMRRAGMAFYPVLPFLLERVTGAYFQHVCPHLSLEYVLGDVACAAD